MAATYTHRIGAIAARTIAGVGVMLASSPALAHIDEETVERYGPFFAGVAHPVLGPDHFLAMVSVGFVSAVLGGRHFWLVPACFVGTMPLGWMLGRLGVPFPPVELGIALSVIALGAGGLLARRIPIAVIYVAVASFALMHGYAHGRETPATNLVQYASGFMVSTAALHLFGLFIGDILYQPNGRNRPVQAISLAVMMAGAYFLTAAVVGFAVA